MVSVELTVCVSAAMNKEQLASRLFQLMGEMSRHRMPAALEDLPEVELTIPQLRTLRLLSDRPRTMTEIASWLGVALPSATGMINRLAEKGLVDRSHDTVDRRIVTCRLTEDGHRIFHQYWGIRRRHVERITSALEEADLQKVVEAMEILTDVLKRETAAQ
jgi:DNA-binding MarR family transcriptional regulator